MIVTLQDLGRAGGFGEEDASCLVLSCLVLSCLVLSCLVLSCLVLSCLVLSCLVLSCLVLSCLVLSCLVLSCLVLSCLVGVLANTPGGVRVGCACCGIGRGLSGQLSAWGEHRPRPGSTRSPITDREILAVDAAGTSGSK